MMIERIDIANFGCYRNFVWADVLRDKGNNVISLKKLNIIYGRNYSGKTTLSRIVRCAETGAIPANYSNPAFSIRTTSAVLTPHSLENLPQAVRVYNKDFVDEHLGFLRNENGDIAPFAVIGSENKALVEEIDELEKQLGSVEAKTGLIYELDRARSRQRSKEEEARREEAQLTAKLTAKATKLPGGIKHNPLYRDPNYNTPKLKVDIAAVGDGTAARLSEQEELSLRKLLAESPLPPVGSINPPPLTLSRLINAAAPLLEAAVEPARPIATLLADPALQAWVKDGMQHHKGKRDTCGFCTSALPSDLWQKLRDHFSVEAEGLEKALADLAETIGDHEEDLNQLRLPELSKFYDSMRADAELVLNEVTRHLELYREALLAVKQALGDRCANIFHVTSLPLVYDNSAELQSAMQTLNRTIAENNKKTTSLDTDQTHARKRLRLNEVALFMADADLAAGEQKIATAAKAAAECATETGRLRREVERVKQLVERRKLGLRDERRGAEKVNSYLSNYFGHGALRLQAVQTSSDNSYEFQVFRGDQPAFNLSEGECSLIAFCYFVAKLEDTESAGKELIIYIDDPVSSLDANHIFFVYSLIESVIARPLTDGSGKELQGPDGKQAFRYHQLFISTHNLEFLKYLRRLPRPRKSTEHLVVTARVDGSVLEEMPTYLKEYVTEFNFLFDQIYICVDPENAQTHLHCFYGFGNNLRKFLEAFLFFKYPFAVSSDADQKRRLHLFFRSTPFADPVVQRLTNEMSHLSGSFDRSTQPVDYSEISRLAKFVLMTIRENDESQYEALLESIGKPDPLSTR